MYCCCILRRNAHKIRNLRRIKIPCYFKKTNPFGIDSAMIFKSNQAANYKEMIAALQADI